MSPQVQSILDSVTQPRVALDRLRWTFGLEELGLALVPDPQTAALVRASSQGHDNGFYKIVLCHSPVTHLKLVLHYWPTCADGGDDNIHNHRWDFASVVLLGSLRSEIYTLNAQEQSYARYQYESPEQTDTYSLHRQERVGASMEACLDLTAGSSYLWGRDILHRAYGIAPSPVATLVVQGPPVRERTEVLLRSTHLPEPLSPVRRLTVAQFDQAMDVFSTSDPLAAWKGSR